MNLITLNFEVAEEDQADFIQALEDMKDFWDENGFVFSQFRDASRKNRFLQLFLTEKTVDDFTALIQSDPRAKKLFEKNQKRGRARGCVLPGTGFVTAGFRKHGIRIRVVFHFPHLT
jgi:hypothetical protein